MRKGYAHMLLAGMIFLTACTGSGQEGESSVIVQGEGSESVQAAEESSASSASSAQPEAAGENKTITFVEGVENRTTHGDKYNFYALRAQARNHDRVTAIIEGTAVDFRTTDNQWYFDYPYPGSSVETEITFTTDPSVVYGDTGIELSSLEPDSYVTITFVPNAEPTVLPPSVSVNEGEVHTFRNESQGIVERVTVLNMEVVEAATVDGTLNPLGNQLLKVEVQYVNEGQAKTHIAPNYFTALDGVGHFQPLRYTHFWLHEVQPGQSFTETIYFDITGEGPYSVQFFDGAWLDADVTGVNGNQI